MPSHEWLRTGLCRAFTTPWVQTFVFVLPSLKPHELEQGTIKASTVSCALLRVLAHVYSCARVYLQFSVFDSNKLMRNELIGSFMFDASTVYLNPDHEFYRQVHLCMQPLQKHRVRL